MQLTKLKPARSAQLISILVLILLLVAGGLYLVFHSKAATCSSPPGDANCDGAVNILDLSILATNWGKTSTTWSMGDFNGDAVVNILDLSLMASHWGSSTVTQLPSPGTWTNVTSNLAGMASQCGNLTMVSNVPNTNEVIAGVAGVGLYVTTNAGTSWSKMGAGSGSDAISNRPTTLTYDPIAGTFWEAGIYGNDFGIYKTTDGGNTFHHEGTPYHIEHVAVDFTDPNRQTQLSGGHEQSQTVDKSTNGGTSWTNIWSTLPTGIGFTPDPVVINSTTYLINAYPSWGGGTPGIYRTTNGGTSWTKVSSEGPDGAALITSDGTLYWADGSSLVKSTDQGQTWTKVGSNLLDITPIQLPDGRLVSANNTSHLVVSADSGSTWTAFGAALPFTPPQGDSADLAYSPSDQAFFISQWDCGNVVLPNAIARLK